LNVTLNRLIRDKQPSEVIEAAQKEKAEMKKNRGAVAGHHQLDRQLAEIFARDAKKAVGVLETCLQQNLQNENDIHMYIINVHAMKSALANIGENELSAIASRLEQAGREKNINVMLTETRDFLDKLHKVINEIKIKYEEENNEDTEDSLAYLHEKLIIFKEACVSLDKKTAKNALNELREKAWSINTKELLNSIAERLLHSEFDDAISLADSYLNKE
jgi:HPt (histidine-containing phosphotransfer) domain-containing protein